jgi:hypothetical protein
VLVAVDAPDVTCGRTLKKHKKSWPFPASRGGHTLGHRLPKEDHVVAIIAALLFLVALIMEVAGLTFAPVTPTVLVDAGLLLVALHLGGIGSRLRTRSRV